MIQGRLRDIAEAVREELARAASAQSQAAVAFNVRKLDALNLDDALKALLPLTGGTKWLFVANGEGEPWAAMFHNRSDCSGSKSLLVTMAAQLKAKAVYGLIEPPTSRKLPDGRRVGKFGAMQVEIYNRERSAERVVSLVNDGSTWNFHNIGRPYPFEQTARYKKSKKTDRFTAEHVVEFLNGFGVRPYNDEWYRCDAKHPAYLIERVDHDEEVRRKISAAVDLERVRAAFAGEE